MTISFPTTVKAIELKKRIAKAWRAGPDDIRTEEEVLGWAILLEGSWEWLFVGDEKPEFEKGDRVVVRIEKAA